MENITRKRGFRKVSSWMADAAASIENEDEIIAVKKIVLKILRYMEANNLSQKDLAEKLGVSPQYMSKFLHGQEDIKVSTALRYGKILGLNLIEIPEETRQEAQTIVLYREHLIVKDYACEDSVFRSYNSFHTPVIKQSFSYNN